MDAGGQTGHLWLSDCLSATFRRTRLALKRRVRPFQASRCEFGGISFRGRSNLHLASCDYPLQEEASSTYFTLGLRSKAFWPVLDTLHVLARIGGLGELQQITDLLGRTNRAREEADVMVKPISLRNYKPAGGLHFTGPGQRVLVYRDTCVAERHREAVIQVKIDFFHLGERRASER